jgi:hypothetical protein
MRNHATGVAILLAIAIVALVALPASAVTWLTANGTTSGTITTPGNIVIRCNASATGARLRFVVGADLDGSGQLEAGEPVLGTLGTVTDGGWTDEDATSGVVQLSGYVEVNVGGPIVLQAVDENGTTVGHVYSMNYTHPAQSVSGTVLYNDGSPGAGLLVSTMMESNLGTVCFTDAAGKFALYLPAGQNLIGVVSNTEGGGFSRSQRGVPLMHWVDLGAGAAKTGENFTMYIGPGSDITGTVTESDTGHPVPAVSVMAQETSTFETVSALSDINGGYALHVFPGTWTVRAEASGQAGPYGDPAEQNVVVGSSNVVVDFSLPHLDYRIYGIVTGPGSAAVSTAWVWAQGTSGYGEASTNGQGHYEIWVTPDSYWVGPSDESGNCTFLTASIAAVTVPPSTRVDLSMVARGYTASGRVTFEGTTTGVPYAEVWFEDTSALYADEFWTITDGQGYYSLKVPAGTFDAYASSWMYWDLAGPVSLTFPPSHSGVNFSLTPSHSAPTLSEGGVTPSSGGVGGQLFTFSVTYTSADNSSPADVYVVIDSWPQPMVAADPSDTDYTDGAVFYYQTTLSAGTHYFWFGALDDSMLQARLPTSGSLGVTAVTGGTVAGYVRDAVTLGGIAGALVQVKSGATVVASGSTDGSGNYSILAPVGTYTVVASSHNYITAEAVGVSVTANQTTTRNFALTPSGIVEGYVTAGGPALADAQVTITGAVQRTVSTDATGYYRIDQDVPAGAYAISASKRFYDTETRTGVSLPAGTVVTEDFALIATGELMGQVRIVGTTTAIQGAEVKAYLGGVLKASATTNADGIYSMTQGLPSGTYVVSAANAGYVTQTKAGISITSGSTSYCNFNLSASGTLMGQVRIKGTTTDLPGAEVKAYLGGLLMATATTNSSGIYSITANLPTGTYVVSAAKDGYCTQTKASISVSAGATTYVNFNLDPSATLMGQVRVKGTTTAIPGATIKAYLGAVLMATGTTASDGIYTIARDLPAGTYVVAASKSGCVTQTKTGISCTAGATTYVNFNLEASGALKGQVRIASTTTDIAGATITCYLGDVLQATGTTDANGIYEINSELPAGTYTVTAAKSGFVHQTKSNIAVTAGVTTFVNFNLQVSGKLKGQVRDAVTGAPLIGATVIARSGGVLRATTTTTAPWGIYEIDRDLPPGTYSMNASKAGYVDQGKIGVVVSAGVTTYVNFNLQPQL